MVKQYKYIGISSNVVINLLSDYLYFKSLDPTIIGLLDNENNHIQIMTP